MVYEGHVEPLGFSDSSAAASFHNFSNLGDSLARSLRLLAAGWERSSRVASSEHRITGSAWQ